MGGLPWGFKIPDGVDGGHHMFPPDLFMVVIWNYHAMYWTFDVSCLNASNFYLNYPELVPASKNGLLFDRKHRLLDSLQAARYS